jgi:hypothetical protein
VEAANWADQVRNKQTAPWHYVNIEISESQYEPARHCPKGQCVIGQIERFRRTLATPSAPRAKRQKALKYLLHFIGDIHQPLHAGENHDRGGNDVQVEFMGQTMNPFNKKPWNLHAVWDSVILEQRDPDPRHFAATLKLWLESRSDKAILSGSVADWAMQSHDIARTYAYDLPADRKLGEGYVSRNVPVVSEQLARAGARLAHVLNEALGNGHADCRRFDTLTCYDCPFPAFPCDFAPYDASAARAFIASGGRKKVTFGLVWWRVDHLCLM